MGGKQYCSHRLWGSGRIHTRGSDAIRGRRVADVTGVKPLFPRVNEWLGYGSEGSDCHLIAGKDDRMVGNGCVSFCDGSR